MHSAWFRLSAVLVFALFSIGAICFAASMTDLLITTIYKPNPSLDIKVVKFDGLRRSFGGNDEVVADSSFIARTLYDIIALYKVHVSTRLYGMYLGFPLDLEKKMYHQARILLNISADLSSLFTWNTKQLFVFVAAEYFTPKNSWNQISLWDSIVTSKNDAKFQLLTYNKYAMIDQGNDLRGSDFNLTLYWHVMPKTGRIRDGQGSLSGFKFPSSYF